MSLAVVRGGGDLATGIVYRLWKTGFSVVVLETSLPTAIRRSVCAAQAVFEKKHVIEGMTVRHIKTLQELPEENEVAILIDPKGASISQLKPSLVVDAIMAKRNCGTLRSMAPCVVGIGPGFTAPKDVHVVVETLRGHHLGRVILKGTAAENTGVPGEVAGESVRRIVRAPQDGYLIPAVSIGERVAKGQILGTVSDEPVWARMDGVLRGLIHEKVPLVAGMKIGDIDARCEPENCFSISDKALAVAGGVLEVAFSTLL